MRDNNNIKPLGDRLREAKDVVFRHFVEDALMRNLYVTTAYAKDLHIINIDAVVTCRRCFRPFLFFEITTQVWGEKIVATTTYLAKIHNEIIPTAAYLVQIELTEVDFDYIPQKLRVYPIFIPAGFSDKILSKTQTLNYAQFKTEMIKVYEIMHLPICAQPKESLKVYLHGWDDENALQSDDLANSQRSQQNR